MKKIKFLIAAIMFIFLTLLATELYQNYLLNFSNQFYYFEIPNTYDQDEVLAFLDKATNDADIDVFAIHRETISSISQKIDIYTTEDMANLLQEKFNIRPGCAKSFISGKTMVFLNDIEDMPDNIGIETFYFSGDEDDVLRAKQIINQKFVTSHVHKEEQIGLEWVIYVVAIFVMILLIAMTWFDIQYQKKENFVYLSVGVNPWYLILKNIVQDITVFTVIFLIIRLIFSFFVSIEYEKNTITFLFVIFLILNALIYLVLLKYDYKEVLCGANIYRMTSSCYVLKAISMMITIACLSINIGLISENMHYVTMYEEINTYQDYSFLKITVDDSKIETIHEKFELKNQILGKVFYQYYLMDKVAMSTCYGEVDDRKVILSNENSAISDKLGMLLENKGETDFYILFPSEYEDVNEGFEFSTQITESYFSEFLINPTYEFITYDEDLEIIFFDTNKTILTLGFEKEDSPLLVYCNVDKFDKNEYDFSSFEFVGAHFNDLMFQITPEDIDNIYKIDDHITNVSSITVSEFCNEYKDVFIRIILLNITISILMMLLEFLVIITIIRMEYSVDAKIFAVKKILGYGIWRKNQAIILLNCFAACIGCATIMTCNFMFNFSEWYYTFISSVILVLLECLIMVVYINKIERSNIPKILKGGSL